MQFFSVFLLFSIMVHANNPSFLDRIHAIDANNFYHELMVGSDKNGTLNLDLQVKKLSLQEQETLKKKMDEVSKACYINSREIESKMHELNNQSDVHDRIQNGIMASTTAGLISLTILLPEPEPDNPVLKSLEKVDFVIIVCGLILGGIFGYLHPTSLDREKMNIYENFCENSKSHHASLSISLLLDKQCSEDQKKYYALTRISINPWQPMDDKLYETLEAFAQNNR